MPDTRQIIRERAMERRLSLRTLSIMIGRNEAYLGQFVTRGTPRRLPDEPRRLLAMALDLDETLLGARMPWMPAVGNAGHEVDA